jgi:hypothetical protein
MPHEIGTYLGGIRCLEDLRQRCVMDGDCWRCKPRVVWIFQRGGMTAKRAAWMLSGGRVRPGWATTEVCGTARCVNPPHLVHRPRAVVVRTQAAQGRARTDRKALANKLAGAKRSRISPEVWRWAMESPQSAMLVAHALDISVSHVSAKRAAARARNGVAW